MQRPLGVTILAVLAVVGGIANVLAGVFASGLGSAASAAGSAGGLPPAAAAAAPGMLSCGIIAFAAGILQLIYGAGLWNLKPWAWVLAVIVTSVALLNAVTMILGQKQYGAVAGALISVVILIYLVRPEVRGAFARR